MISCIIDNNVSGMMIHFQNMFISMKVSQGTNLGPHGCQILINDAFLKQNVSIGNILITLHFLTIVILVLKAISKMIRISSRTGRILTV